MMLISIIGGIFNLAIFSAVQEMGRIAGICLCCSRQIGGRLTADAKNIIGATTAARMLPRFGQQIIVFYECAVPHAAAATEVVTLTDVLMMLAIIVIKGSAYSGSRRSIAVGG